MDSTQATARAVLGAVSPSDPDTLAAEFEGRGVVLSAPLSDTDDGLRGFELADRDGYLLFFGLPR